MYCNFHNIPYASIQQKPAKSIFAEVKSENQAVIGRAQCEV